jgi:uncharacterized repeat protein (TIGR01451 family)
MKWGRAARRGIARRLATGVTVAALALAAGPRVHAQGEAARPLVTAAIDETQLVRLAGNTRPEAIAANDRGRVPDSLPLEHLQLLLRRPPEREAALRRYIAQLHRHSSPLFHRWTTAGDFGRRFGVAAQDLATVTDWLQQHGFTVNGVYPNNMVIDFSGPAGAVRGAFHTEIHALAVHGARHLANVSDPQIPAVLAPAVAGIVSLHDFRPYPTVHDPTVHGARPAFTFSSTQHLVVPADLATIYNLNPLFSAGITGEGQTIVVIEDSNVYDSNDWSTFRSAFGLSGYSTGTFTQVQPGGINNCANPGANGDDGEAIIDAEWASAAAPAAAIELASCADTMTFGGLLALENLINAGGSPPAIVSISYSACEAQNGVTGNEAFSAIYQQAVSEGVSVFVAAGDWGAALCDAADQTKQNDWNYATQGIAVNGFASTPYNVAVGGTDFGDTYAGTTSTYWSPTNSGVYGSALSYIPEIPWNESCASTLVASFLGYATPYGSGGLCNSQLAQQDNLISIIAGSGGPSSCAVAAGSGCAGTPKPSWQAGPGVPGDGVRDLPDVSLFAADGPWGHAYVFCESNANTTCTTTTNWSSAGGTSFAAPIFAGIQALVNQSTASRQGNPNFVYYTLAASQSASGLGCNSSSGNAVANGCVFYDITLGDMDVDCQGSSNCYLPSGTYGVLSTSDSSYAKAFGAGPGWDFATGLGSVNAANLVKYWTSSDISLTVTGAVTAGGLLSFTLTVGNHGPQSATVTVSTVLPAGVTLVAGSSSAGCSQKGQTVSCSVGTSPLAAGATAAPITIVVQTAGSGTVSLTFTAGSGNPDLYPADGTATVSLSATTAAPATADAPLPLWANGALALLLLAIAMRRVGAAARDAPTPR